MTKYSHEENATAIAMTFKMKMQQITEKKLQKSSFMTFMGLK